MEIFIELKKMLKLIGVLEFDHRHSKMIQYFLIIFGFVITILFVLSAFWFFCFDTNTFIEQVECFLALNSALHMYTLFVMLMQKRKVSSEIIMKMEAGINKCKMSIPLYLSIGWKCMIIFTSGEQYSLILLYNSANKKIEYRTNQIAKIYAIFLPCFFFPMMIVSYYKYFALNTSEESFSLGVLAT